MAAFTAALAVPAAAARGDTAFVVTYLCDGGRYLPVVDEPSEDVALPGAGCQS